MINEPKLTWEGKTETESAMIMDEVFMLRTPSGTFDSEYDLEVTKVTDRDGNACFSASMFQGRAHISEALYKLLSQTSLSTEIRVLDTDDSLAEGFELRLAGLHLPPHKAP